MYRKMLVPVDGSETAMRGLQEAITLAKALGSRLQLLTVVDEHPLMVEPASIANVDELRKTMRHHGDTVLARARNMATDEGVEADTDLVVIASGRVADVVLSKSREQACDLIVMGTHGRRGLTRAFLGSDAELVLRGSSVPVLLVRRPEGVP